MKNLLLPLVVSSLFATNAIAEDETISDHYVSVGKSTITSELNGDEVSIDGFGFHWYKMDEGKNWGFGVNMEFAANSDSVGTTVVDELMWNVSISVPYRPESAQWLTIYPMIGMSFYTIDLSNHYASANDSANGLNYGIGASAVIPETSIFVDFNYKIHNISDFDEAGIDLSSLYMGVGYKF